MNDAQVLSIVTDMFGIATKIAAPILLAALIIGVMVSLLQTVTQIQEMTLTFVPKLVGVALIILFAGNWMLGEVVAYMHNLWTAIPTML